MRRRKVLIIAGIVVVALAGVLAVVCFGKWSSPPPIVNVSVTGTEPAGIFDESGVEMALVTLSITASKNPSGAPAKPLFIKGVSGHIEGKVAERWVPLETTLWNIREVWPSFNAMPAHRVGEMLVAMPAHTVGCRFRLQYARALFTDTQSAWLARKLPKGMPFYQRLWKWVRDRPYKPSGIWREIEVEVPLPHESAGGKWVWWCALAYVAN
jgi:hypothetical protein